MIYESWTSNVCVCVCVFFLAYSYSEEGNLMSCPITLNLHLREVRSVTEPEAMLVASNPRKSSLSLYFTELGLFKCPFFKNQVVLGIWTWILLLEQQVLLPTEPSSHRFPPTIILYESSSPSSPPATILRHPPFYYFEGLEGVPVTVMLRWAIELRILHVSGLFLRASDSS